MTVFKTSTAGFFSILFTIGAAQAEISQTDAQGISEIRAASHSVFVMGEFSGGSSSLGSSATSTASGTGSQLSAALLGSWNTAGALGAWTLEGGAGLFENTIAGSSKTFTQFQLNTTALLAKVAPQYHLTENLQLGPVAELLFGADVGFDTSLADDSQTRSLLVGAQALYALHLGAYPLKVGIRYLSSTDLPANSLRSVEATIQIGVPVL